MQKLIKIHVRVLRGSIVIRFSLLYCSIVFKSSSDFSISMRMQNFRVKKPKDKDKDKEALFNIAYLKQITFTISTLIAGSLSIGGQ